LARLVATVDDTPGHILWYQRAKFSTGCLRAHRKFLSAVGTLRGPLPIHFGHQRGQSNDPEQR
jgi:hypothetical protein